MDRLRSRFLILMLLGLVLLPQLYQAVHLVSHHHAAACVEVNVTHFHEKHPDCKLCVHVVPAFFAAAFNDFSVHHSSHTFSFIHHCMDQVVDTTQPFFWHRGPPHFVFV